MVVMWCDGGGGVFFVKELESAWILFTLQGTITICPTGRGHLSVDDDFPFAKVRYVSFLEGNPEHIVIPLRRGSCFFRYRFFGCKIPSQEVFECPSVR